MALTDFELTNKFNNPYLTRAKDISSMMPYWFKVDAIIKGLDKMRELGEEFLPKFPDESDKDYAYRLNMTKLTNVYRDVLEGLATKPFESEVGLIKSDKKEVPAELMGFIENVNGGGDNLTVFASRTFFNGINNAIDWIFVDFPEVDTSTTISVAQAAARNLRPYWTHVLAKNVLEVKTKVIGSKQVISLIRIYEPSVDGEDDRIRVFERDDNDIVTWKLMRLNPTAQKSEDAVIEEKKGVLGIKVIPLVPFITGRRDGSTWRFFPAMQDAADLQITLYQNESGLEYIKALACFPMLAANGIRPQMEPDGKTVKKLAVGPSRVLYSLPDGNGNIGTWGYVEPQANSMEFMQKNIAATKTDLRELGRQPLTALSTQLTTTTTMIAAGKARSAVSTWALGLKDTLENALSITLMYMKSTYEPEVFVYTGFDNVDGSGEDVVELGKARERRDISNQTYTSELKRRKILSPEYNFEEDAKLLLNEVPSDGLESPAVRDDTKTKGNANAA